MESDWLNYMGPKEKQESNQVVFRIKSARAS